MPTVAELTDVYTNLLLNPWSGPGVCETCFTFTDGYTRCYVCERAERTLDAVAPISYSIAGEQLHHVLAGYKRFGGDVARRMQIELAAVLWRYLADHEPCVATAAGVHSFPIVTTVPSSSRMRDERHPLRHIVGEIAAPTRDRYERLVTRTVAPVEERTISAEKYVVAHQLSCEPVLLIDDTWTTGANAQSAAVALRAAGAGPIALVVIGRHIRRDWHDNDQRLRQLPRPFQWDECIVQRRG
jgi:predicted amidophosphoribosyltransferase